MLRGDDSFYSFMYKVLKDYCKLNQQDIDILLNEENIIFFEQAFTHRSFSREYNYEIAEKIGDAQLRTLIVLYFFDRFPQLSVEETGNAILSRLQVKYLAKDILSQIAMTLQLEPFIQSRELIDNNILEDVFEALIGTILLTCNKLIGLGVGYFATAHLVEHCYNKLEITLNYDTLIDFVHQFYSWISVNKNILKYTINVYTQYNLDQTYIKTVRLKVFYYDKCLLDKTASNKKELIASYAEELVALFKTLPDLDPPRTKFDFLNVKNSTTERRKDTIQ